MSAGACARSASELTALANRLGRAGRALDRQARLPTDEFGGLSGDAYRRHADRSAHTVAGLASDLALLAGALAALGRELEAAQQLQQRGFDERAADAEARAQHAWRGAVARFDGRPSPGPGLDQPVVTAPVLTPEDVPRPPVAEAAATATATATATTTATTSPVAAPAAAAPPSEPQPTLVSSFVAPPELESELITPPMEPPRCGTTEVLLDDQA